MTRRERLEAKVAKRQAWAESRNRKADQAFARASAIADNIPLGQPILVGHHSEKRARRDQERIQNGMSKGIEHSNMAKEHVSKAFGLADQLASSIYSDDPDGIQALQARIAERTAKLEKMKNINNLYRKKDAASLAAIGIDYERLRAQLEAPDTLSWCRVPHPTYEISNLRANIRRDEQRIKEVETRQARSARATASGGTLVEVGRDGESCQVTFEEKPEYSMIQALKAAQFRWSNGSWFGLSSKLPTDLIQES